jgi:hypothetical protein
MFVGSRSCTSLFGSAALIRRLKDLLIEIVGRRPSAFSTSRLDIDDFQTETASVGHPDGVRCAFRRVNKSGGKALMS